MAQSIIQGPNRTRQPEIFFGAILGGEPYRFTLTWISRMQWWNFEMALESGQPLIQGVRVVADVDMIQPYNMPELPPGQIICHDTTNLAQPPGRLDWVQRHLLLYVDPVPAPPGPTIRIRRKLPDPDPEPE